MIRYLFIAFLLFSSMVAAAQATAGHASAELDLALVAKDSVAVKKLMDACATYGHSNGWLQSPQDVVNDMLSGKLNYSEIKNSEVKWEGGEEQSVMRCRSDVKYRLDGKEHSITLHVVQVWVKKDKSWRLIARQAVKI